MRWTNYLVRLQAFYLVADTHVYDTVGDKSGRAKAEADLLLGAMRDVGLLRAAGVEHDSNVPSDDEKNVHHIHEKSTATHTPWIIEQIWQPFFSLLEGLFCMIVT
jgi:hypothetical protein